MISPVADVGPWIIRLNSFPIKAIFSNTIRIISIKRGEIGVDGALLRDTTVFIYKVNFIEKILATVLAKMSNFIPEGGIWMNTQRPEWNDANNALVGNGVSMVTLYYLRRFLKFFSKVLNQDSSSHLLLAPSRPLHAFDLLH